MRLPLLQSLARPLASLTVFMLTLATCLPRGQAQNEADAKENDPLTTYRGKNRLVLVIAPSDADPQFNQQIADLKNKPALNERQTVVMPILADDKAAGKSLPFILNKFNGGKSSFSVVLIGKDGSAAYQSAEPVAAETLYAKIDSMPMRKEEMKEKKADAGKEDSAAKKSDAKDN